MYARHAVLDLRNAALAVAALTITALACARADADPAEPAVVQPHVAAATPVAAGDYLLRVGSCDDCHTPGWAESGGTLPDSMRLMGAPLGFRGPWGTSYPANLRLSVLGKSAPEWVAAVRTRKGLPPMPWFSLQRMADRDLEAIYAYLTELGPRGEPVPAALPPTVEPTTPYIVFAPVFPKEVAQ